MVKSINDCGNSICGECHEALLDQADKTRTRSFYCFICQVQHRLPKNGFSDNVVVKELLLLLQHQANGQAIDAADTPNDLHTQIDALQQKVLDLRNADENEYINSYCDSLLAEVNSAYEAALEHLKGIKSQLFKQINEYRSDVSDKRLQPPSAKRVGRRAANQPCTSKEASSEQGQPPDHDDLDLLAVAMATENIY